MGYKKGLYGIVDERGRVEVADMAALLAGVAGQLHVDDGGSLGSDGLFKGSRQLIGCGYII